MKNTLPDDIIYAASERALIPWAVLALALVLLAIMIGGCA